MTVGRDGCGVPAGCWAWFVGVAAGVVGVCSPPSSSVTAFGCGVGAMAA